MINKSDAYREAIVADARRTFVKVDIDLSSPDLAYTGYAADSVLQPFDPEKVHDRNTESPAKIYRTLELNRWLLDGNVEQNDAYIGDYCSERLQEQETQFFELQFSGVSVLQAFSIGFSTQEADSIPMDFNISFLSGSSVVWSRDWTNNEEIFIAVEGFTVYNPTALRVTVSRMGLPYRRFRLNEIVLGIFEEWSEDMVSSLQIKQQGDFSCATLPYGTCTMGIDNSDRRFEPRNKNGIFQSIQERQAIPISIGVQLADGSKDFTPVGVYFQCSTGWKTSDNGITMEWSLVDIIGLLAQRDYTATQLFTTLEDWATDILAQLGASFASRLTIDPNYADMSITVNSLDDVTGKSCGDMLLNICMASGTFPRADSETGNLCIEPLWNQGNYISLDNIENYPTMSANDDVSIITFTLSDDTEVVISGNNTASDKSIAIKNPFLHTQEQAVACARNILTMYGGNTVEIIGRGDMSSEIGDVDTIQLDESTATSARRIKQEFEFRDGVMTGLTSNFVQPDGGLLYSDYDLITESGSWQVPTGVTAIRVVVGGGGDGGRNGSNGSYSSKGADGADGAGGKILVQNMQVNAGQSISISIGAGGAAGQPGGNTTCGVLSSADGQVYDPSYTDIMTGNTYGRTGVAEPLAGTSDGGKGGAGGRKGNKHTVKYTVSNPDGTVEVKTKTVIDNTPGSGATGKTGASGFVLIYYDRPE